MPILTARRRRARGSTAPRRLRERGAVAVEFALIAPILAMLLLGTVTTGYSYSHIIGVKNAVREGARFGATTDATDAVTDAWATAVIARVRQTQFDDPTQQTDICVQLWQGTTQLKGKCDHGDNSVSPQMTLPANATVRPAVPAGLPAGACVVRVIAARNYTIGFVLGSVSRASVSVAVSRYERMDKFPTCT